MKYSVYLDQKFMLKHDLSINAAALLSLIHSAPSWAENLSKGWYWLSYSSIIAELPAFFSSKQVVTRARQELVNKDMIKQKVVKNKNLFMLTEKGKLWGREVVSKMTGGIKNDTRGGIKNDTRGGIKNDTQSEDYNHNTKNHIRTPISPKGDNEQKDDELPKDFVIFYEAYPRKQSKQDAIKAWDQTKKIRPHIDIVLAAVEEQKTWSDWTKNGGQFIPYPGSWLRAGGWDNKLPEVQQSINTTRVREITDEDLRPRRFNYEREEKRLRGKL